jgi:hypothetical protein
MTFRRTVTATAAAAILPGLGGAPPAGATAMPGPSATVALSTHRAGARPVALTLRLRFEMQCAWPGTGPLTIRLPAAMSVPLRIAPATVLIAGKPAMRVGHSGHRVVLGLPPRPQILCDAIAPGTLTITFTRAARLGNPKLADIYRLAATKGSLEFRATLTIDPR